MKEMNESWDAETSRRIKEKQDLMKRIELQKAIKIRMHDLKRKEMFGDE
jgi:hypothetical protein